MDTSEQRRRLRVTFDRAKDRYCYSCDDGGRVIDCSVARCTRTYCYSLMGETRDESYEDQACVTIPEDMTRSDGQPFQCPECLADNPPRAMDYIINRGSRNTRRLSSRSSVVIVMYYLLKLKDQADNLRDQLTSILAAFEVHTIVEVYKLPDRIPLERVDEILEEVRPEAPYHVVAIFVTEGNPDGGWWVSAKPDKEGDQQVSEDNFLQYCLLGLGALAYDAVTARVFGVACGINLTEGSSVGRAFDALDSMPWHSLVIPTAASLLLSEYLPVLPELFVELYYFVSPLRSSLLRVWLKSEEARTHTGLLVYNRPSWREGSLQVARLEHAPASRPLGVDLPMVPSLCGCWDRNGVWRRHHISYSETLEETFLFFRSSCCDMELHVAIYNDRRKLLEAHDTTAIEEIWNKESMILSFDPCRMVSMRLSRRRIGKEEQKQRPVHKTPWTLAGLEAQRRKAEEAMHPTNSEARSR